MCVHSLHGQSRVASDLHRCVATGKRPAYIDRVPLTIDSVMSLQITNLVVVDKLEQLARATGSSKTAAVEQAVAKLLEWDERGLPR